MNKISQRLEEAIDNVVNAGAENDYEVLKLMQVSSEAVGVLRSVEDFNVKDIIYDMAILAGGGGWIPDHFEERVKKG